MRIITKEEAETSKYIVVAGPYRNNAQETKMLGRVMEDMRGCRVVLVDTELGRELWRHKSEMDVYLRYYREGTLLPESQKNAKCAATGSERNDHE